MCPIENSVRPVFMEGKFKIRNGFQYITQIVLHLKEKVRSILEGTQACEIFDIFCSQVEGSFFLKFLIISIISMTFLPLFAFGLFAILSFIITFVGFLLLEGSLLVLAACAAILWFGAVGIILILAGSTTVLCYLLYLFVGHFAFKIQKHYLSPNSENVVLVGANHED